MWLMLQKPKPSDYVIATGVSKTVNPIIGTNSTTFTPAKFVEFKKTLNCEAKVNVNYFYARYGTTPENTRVDLILELNDIYGNVIGIIGLENKVDSAEQEEQLADYLHSEALDEGYYVVFSNRHSDQDTLYSDEVIQGKRIYTWIIRTDFKVPSRRATKTK